MQGMIVRGQSSIRKSGGFFPHPVGFCSGGRNTPFPGRAGHTPFFPALGLQGCCRDCAVLVLLLYILIFFLPSLTLGHVRLNAKRAGMGMGTRPTQTLNLSLNPETLWQYFGRYSWLRLHEAAWEGWIAAVSFTPSVFSAHWTLGQHSTAGHHL